MDIDNFVGYFTILKQVIWKKQKLFDWAASHAQSWTSARTG